MKRTYRWSVLTGLIVLLSLAVRGDATAMEVSNVTPRQAQQLLASKASMVVLDIRTPREFRHGRIAGARNIDFYSRSFRGRLAKLDRNATYLLYCHQGVRSAASLKMFRKLGFRNVFHMPAGMKGWRRAKLVTVRQ